MKEWFRCRFMSPGVLCSFLLVVFIDIWRHGLQAMVVLVQRRLCTVPQFWNTSQLRFAWNGYLHWNAGVKRLAPLRLVDEAVRRFFLLGQFSCRLFSVDLIKPVSNVHLYVLPSTEIFLDLNKIWHVGRGRWVMHECTTVCSMTRSNVKVTGPWKLEILPFFKSHLLHQLQWELATDHWFLN